MSFKNITSGVGTLFIAGFVVLLIVVGVVVMDVGSTAYDEVGPRATMRKYEWFKDAYAQTQAKEQDIRNYTSRIQRLRAIEKPSVLQQQELFQTETELQGMIMSYNSLAQEYNASSSKFNWEFAKSDELPRRIENWRAE